MRQAFIIITILILSIAFAIEDNTMTQVLNPEFSRTELSIPKSINFQGYLYRDEIPMDTTMNMWFGIYTALSGGSLLFQQTINNVVVDNGWFTVTLDNIPNSVFPVSGPTRYLEVKAPSTGPALEPRISLVSVGYSYHAITSDTAEYAKEAPVGSHSHTLIHTGEVTGSGSVNGSWALTITNGAVTNAKLGPNAVTSAKIFDGTIIGDDIASPCSLQGSVALPSAILNIRNNGGGRGIIIDRVGGHGIYVDSTPAGSGLYINKASIHGIYVDSSGGSGFYVDESRLNGLQVNDAARHGVRIYQADSCGLFINSALNGVLVDNAGIYGVRVMKANNGFRVDTATTHGLRVLCAYEDGIHIWDAGRDGVRVWRADENGVYVDSAGYYGVYAKGENGGIYGKGPTSYTGGNGVTGYARNNGVFGQSTYWEGVSGEAGVDDGVEGYYNGTLSSYAGVRGRRESYGYGVYYVGGLGGSGTKSAIVRTSKGPVALYCQESPENWFEDFGEGRLIDGHCRIELDRLFLETVTINDQYPIKVFIQLRDDCMGVYVKTDNKGFDVYELQSGISNAAFTYRVVAKRKGFEGLRLKTEEIGYTDHLLYPDPTDQQIPTKIRAKRLEEIEKRKKDDAIRKTNQIEKFTKEVKSSKIEINKPEEGRNE
jgi:hypothetical protein